MVAFYLGHRFVPGISFLCTWGTKWMGTRFELKTFCKQIFCCHVKRNNIKKKKKKNNSRLYELLPQFFIVCQQSSSPSSWLAAHTQQSSIPSLLLCFVFKILRWWFLSTWYCLGREIWWWCVCFQLPCFHQLSIPRGLPTRRRFFVL